MANLEDFTPSLAAYASSRTVKAGKIVEVRPGVVCVKQAGGHLAWVRHGLAHFLEIFEGDYLIVGDSGTSTCPQAIFEANFKPCPAISEGSSVRGSSG